MKLHLLIIVLFFPVLCLAQTKVNYDDLQEVDGKFYMAGSKTPFTGQCYTTYPSGKLGMGGSFKNGLRDGEWIWFYETGTKKRYANYKDGVKQGTSVFYYKTGIKKCEIIFDNDKNIRQVSYDEKGNKTKNPSFDSFQ